MAERMKLKDRTAVITGAAGGIGRAIAVSLARRGCHLALADVDETGMTGTEELARPYGVCVTRHHVDVANRADVAGFFPARVADDHRSVDLLVNNAASQSAAVSIKFQRRISNGSSRSTSGAWCA